MLSNLVNGTSQFQDILICFTLALVLGLCIAFTHKVTSNSSKNFLITLTVLPMIVDAVIFMVNGNLGTSIATLGVFGLIRFRSLPATSKEILTVFFAMAIGLACGMEQIGFGILLTLFGCVAMILFTYIPLFDHQGNKRVLKLSLSTDDDYQELYSDLLKKYTSKVEVSNIKYNANDTYDVKYIMDLKKDVNEKSLLDQIKLSGKCKKISLSTMSSESDF